jgi:hypothetical protein
MSRETLALTMAAPPLDPDPPLDADPPVTELELPPPDPVEPDDPCSCEPSPDDELQPNDEAPRRRKRTGTAEKAVRMRGLYARGAPSGEWAVFSKIGCTTPLEAVPNCAIVGAPCRRHGGDCRDAGNVT